jgi:hypothetical protein
MVKTLPAANKNENVPYNLFNNFWEAKEGVKRTMWYQVKEFAAATNHYLISAVSPQPTLPKVSRKGNKESRACL